MPSETASKTREEEASSRRVLRYVLQSAARELLRGHRVKHCLRTALASSVDVYHAPAQGSAHFGGLMVCGSHWVCLPCAVKIASRRVVEVERAVEIVQQHGGTVVFATNTVPHYAAQALPGLLDAFLKAVRALKCSSAYRGLVDRHGFLGEIRSLEVTEGVNGWHPHTHSLLFLDTAYLSLEAFDAKLKELWAKVVARHGLGAVHAKHGLDLQQVGRAAGEDAATTAAYVVKVGEEVDADLWGAADELVRGNSKQGRRGGRTPFSLLADYALLEDKDAGALFRRYAEAFKGKNHLRWSRGLREQLGLEPGLTDQEIVEREIEDADLLGTLDRHQWRAVLKGGRAARGELLEVARAGNWAKVLAFVEPLLQAYQREAGVLHGT